MEYFVGSTVKKTHTADQIVYVFDFNSFTCVFWIQRDSNLRPINYNSLYSTIQLSHFSVDQKVFIELSVISVQTSEVRVLPWRLWEVRVDWVRVRIPLGSEGFGHGFLSHSTWSSSPLGPGSNPVGFWEFWLRFPLSQYLKFESFGSGFEPQILFWVP